MTLTHHRRQCHPGFDVIFLPACCTLLSASPLQVHCLLTTRCQLVIMTAARFTELPLCVAQVRSRFTLLSGSLLPVACLSRLG